MWLRVTRHSACSLPWLLPLWNCLSGATGIQAVSMPVCVWGELQRPTASLIVFSRLFLPWGVSGCIFWLGGGVLAATCIVQVALWSFGTDALQLCKLAARWKPRLVAQVPS